jgi:hypothetical protein
MIDIVMESFEERSVIEQGLLICDKNFVTTKFYTWHAGAAL